MASFFGSVLGPLRLLSAVAGSTVVLNSIAIVAKKEQPPQPQTENDGKLESEGEADVNSEASVSGSRNLELNGALPSTSHVLDCCRNLNRSVMRLYGKFMNDDGTAIDYKGIRASSMFRDDLLPRLALLHHVPLEQLVTLPLDDRVAFFLNLYNILTIHALLERGVPSTSRARLQLFAATGYQIGEAVFTLDAIEHGILRGNQPHPSGLVTLLGGGPVIGSANDDPRAALVLAKEDVDPRMHFALVCGAKSCPPVRIFTGERLRHDLALAANVFCSRDGGNILIDARPSVTTVRLSQIFMWYRQDFLSNKEDNLVGRIAEYVTNDDAWRDKLLQISKERHVVEWLQYDWRTNAKPQSEPSKAQDLSDTT